MKEKVLKLSATIRAVREKKDTFFQLQISLLFSRFLQRSNKYYWFTLWIVEIIAQMGIMRMNKVVLNLLGNFEGHNGSEWTTCHVHLSYIQEQLKLSNKQNWNSNDIVQYLYWHSSRLAVKKMCYQTISKFSVLCFCLVFFPSKLQSCPTHKYKFVFECSFVGSPFIRIFSHLGYIY